MIVGNQEGRVYSLDPAAQNHIGRGTECSIMISDSRCSRVHAVVEKQGELWHVTDQKSRNGTYVNGQKANDAALAPGHVIRVGSTQFSFNQSEVAKQSSVGADATVTQTLVMEAPIAGLETQPLSIDPVPDKEQARELLLLYQLSIKLLGCEDPRQVIEIALELVGERTKAAVVGFLWLDDEGHLKPQHVIPTEGADRVTLDDSLTSLVIREGHAVWIANQEKRETNNTVKLERYADAVCAPLVHRDTTLGAIHVYLDHGRFRQSDFDFAISVANIVAVALVRARRQRSLQSDLERLKEQSPGFDELIGECEPILQLKSKIQRVARAAGCVLIRGESGAGKELVARAIHQASPRADRPLLSVNCAAIPADLMESQLFGHKAGAFTGADRDHLGYFAQADLGTLFLDEVGEMTLEGQAKLLRILEGHPFLPVGSTEEVRVDVRVIAATNQDLQAYVRDKKFREDLYYRLSVFELQLPPLRKRGSDIGRLIDFFLSHFRDQHGRPQLELSDSARQQLLTYSWPGNVRQLRNVIDSAVVLAEGDAILSSDLALQSQVSGELDTLKLDYWERKLIGEALHRTAGNVPEAAKLLGLGRATLYRKIEQYGISR